MKRHGASSTVNVNGVSRLAALCDKYRVGPIFTTWICSIGMHVDKPRWVRDLLRFLPLRSQFVLSGNVRDQYPVAAGSGNAVVPLPLLQVLGAELRDVGVTHFLAYDPAMGFAVPPIVGMDARAEREFFAQNFGLNWSENGRMESSIERFSEVLAAIVTSTGAPVALFAFCLADAGAARSADRRREGLNVTESKDLPSVWRRKGPRCVPPPEF